jgi:hypothetical protein
VSHRPHQVHLERQPPVLLDVRDGQRAHVGDDGVEAVHPPGRGVTGAELHDGALVHERLDDRPTDAAGAVQP